MKKIVAVMIVGLLTTPAIAQMQGMDHSKMDMPMPAEPATPAGCSILTSDAWRRTSNGAACGS